MIDAADREGGTPPRDARWTRVALCAGAIILAAGYLLRTPAIGYDGEQYLTYARHLLATGTFTFDGVHASCGRAPGYPAFLAAFLWSTGGISWVYPVQAALLFLSFWFTTRAFAPYLSASATAGLLVLLTLVWPLHGLAMLLATEPLFMALTSLALWLLQRHLVRGDGAALVGSGLAFGLSAYVRPVNLLAAAFLGFFLIWRRRLSWRRAAVLAGVGLITVAPWTIRNLVVFDRFVPMAAHHGSIYYMTDSELFWPVLLRSAGYTHTLPIYREIVGDDLETDWQANERYLAYAWKNIERDPFGFVGRCLIKTVFVWSYLPGSKGWIFGQPVLFFAGILLQCAFLIISWKGLIALRRRRSDLSDVIVGFALYTTIVLFPFYSESRFLLPVYIWLLGTAWYWVQQRFSLRMPFSGG
ncbi:MAG: hypothetical protein HY304_09760 [candidate division Zixibacteria bacterium]|nr:hypothetical protein [candidate division Zixibacteria bacterium]